ncbi:EAL domain-containing protein [Salinicola avicenniae]|uniref:EAL domain-containing protein n=1 Tax=Salinicola avicenniae TaxID=2916836 RepID=UPI00207429CB|nr:MULTISPECIES: cyclic diguanylate phosphodiesterase [unclassified Salinicola]
MPLSRSRYSSPFGLPWAWLVALLPLLLGAPLIYWQAERAHERQTAEGIRQAQGKLEQILDYADNATTMVSSLVGISCQTAVLPLREHSMATPFVRSLNLTHQGNIYCTSLYGISGAPEEPEQYVDGQLRLMPGNQVTPERAVLIFRRETTDGSVLAGIDTQYLADTLQLTSLSAPIDLQIGDLWLDAQGNTFHDGVGEQATHEITTTSSRYPFSLRASPDDTTLWPLLRADFGPLLIMLALLSLLFGIGARALERRSNSPLREIRRGLRDNEFEPFYQPIVDIETNTWKGLEVLMRWNHPQAGLIPPDQFVPLAERSGLIVGMTSQLMAKVAKDLAPHVYQLSPGFHVGFNISASHCEGKHLLEQCQQFLSAFPADTITLVLELTERELLKPSEMTTALFETLGNMNIRIAIDDFGTGNASLAYLRQFHVDYLKIDRSFVAMVGQDALSHHLLDNIIDLSTRLNLGIVAEGIETTLQRDYLSQRGVQFLQGYLYARPMPAEDLMRTLATSPESSPVKASPLET